MNSNNNFLSLSLSLSLVWNKIFSQKRSLLAVELTHFWIVELTPVERPTCLHQFAPSVKILLVSRESVNDEFVIVRLVHCILEDRNGNGCGKAGPLN